MFGLLIAVLILAGQSAPCSRSLGVFYTERLSFGVTAAAGWCGQATSDGLEFRPNDASRKAVIRVKYAVVPPGRYSPDMVERTITGKPLAPTAPVLPALKTHSGTMVDVRDLGLSAGTMHVVAGYLSQGFVVVRFSLEYPATETQDLESFALLIRSWQSS
jgi:hypothetical protein